jgi:hypothetical protein
MGQRRRSGRRWRFISSFRYSTLLIIPGPESNRRRSNVVIIMESFIPRKKAAGPAAGVGKTGGRPV